MRTPAQSLAILVIVSAALVACDVKLGFFEKDRAAALSATSKLHILYNEQKGDQLYELGSQGMQQSIPRPQFKESLANTRLQAGKQLSSTLVGSSCFPSEVRIVYHSQFESGPFTESILWALPGTTPQLVRYHIASGHAPTDKQAQKGCPT
jgi:hypothetical protein